MKGRIAEKIRVARISQNLSQQNMADELDLTVAAYSNIERGVTELSIKRLMQICLILKLNPVELLNSVSLDQLPDENSKYNDHQFHQEGLAQQLYIVIQQIQQLQSQVDELKAELAELKK